jgi:hypothetical protein
MKEGKPETMAIFKRCVGRVFPVDGFDKGLIELEVGAVVGEFSAAHSIWIEPEFLERAKEPKKLKSTKFLLGFPQSDRVAVQVREPSEGSRRNFDWRHENLPAEGLRLVEVGFHVVHLNVHGHVVVRFMAEGCDVSVDAATASGVNHGCWPSLLHFPTEELREEGGSFRPVATANFEVNYWLTHRRSRFLLKCGKR